MPNCFQLIPKDSNEPESLNSIDEKICMMLNIPIDAEKYCCYWYDTIGFKLAIGQNFAEIIERLTTEYGPDDVWTRIAIWLNENYTSSAWAHR